MGASYYYNRHDLKVQADYGQLETEAGCGQRQEQRAPRADPVHLLVGGDDLTAELTRAETCRFRFCYDPSEAARGSVAARRRFMKRVLVGAGGPGAVSVHRRAPRQVKVDPAHRRLPEGERRLGQPQQHRLRHDEQPDDAVGRGVPQDVPEREGPGRGQGLLDRAAGADRRHGAVRADVARDARHRDRPVRAEVRLQADPAPHFATTPSRST